MWSVKLLGLQLDAKLNFNLHISNICKSAANQLTALIRLKKFMNFEQNKILIHNLFYGHLQLLHFSLDVIQSKFTKKSTIYRKEHYGSYVMTMKFRKRDYYQNFLPFRWMSKD